MTQPRNSEFGLARIVLSKYQIVLQIGTQNVMLSMLYSNAIDFNETEFVKGVLNQVLMVSVIWG